MRRSNSTHGIKSILEKGVQIDGILDVGVYRCTPYLMKCFPDKPHYLFEPMLSMKDDIEEKYKDFDFKLYQIAVSDFDGEGYCINMFKDLEGKRIFSQLSFEKPNIEDYKNLIDIKEIKVRTLNTIYQEDKDLSETKNLFLKIDVDGHEINVLNGTTDILKHCNIVMIEATLASLSERTSFLENRGFQLIDIVDLCYYDKILWQADLVFVSKKLLNENKRLSPMLYKKAFEKEKWFHFI